MLIRVWWIFNGLFRTAIAQAILFFLIWKLFSGLFILQFIIRFLSKLSLLET